MCKMRKTCWIAVLAMVLPAAWGLTGEPEKPVAGQVPAEEPPWIYEDDGRRDPFTFMKPIVIKTDRPDVTPREQLQEKRLEAERNYHIAANAFMSGNPKAAVAACDAGLEAFRDIRTDEVPELQEMRERLFRLRKASERQRNRQDAEEAFDKLNLRLTGVVARERDSKAIINGKLAERGDLINPADHSEGALVDDIQPGRVIFRFRGYRIELKVLQYTSGK